MHLIPIICSHEMFSDIRIVDENGEPWFVGKDVCNALEFTNHRNILAYHCKDVRKVTIQTNGGLQTLSIISSKDVFRLATHSTKPNAKDFEKWVYEELLPTIDKTGRYDIHEDKKLPERPFSEREMCERYLQSLIREEEYQRKIEEDAPKVEFYDTVTASETVCDLAIACQVAKLPFGKNTLFRMLREDGVLISSRTRWNLPKQEYINRKYFTVSESTYKHPKTGEQEVSFKTQCTQKGIEWLMKRYGVLCTEQEVQQNRIGFRAD